jgi:hypothetical protein
MGVPGLAKILRVWLLMSYRCCGMEWTDEWPSPLKLECPDCGELIEAHEIAEIGPRHASRQIASAGGSKVRAPNSTLSHDRF